MRDARLTIHAKAMRHDPTPAEQKLWFALRAKRFENIKFRRQKVIGRYIADFASRESMLVIELDGDTHAARQGHDADRTAFLEGQGYRVIRFANAEVMGNLEGVLEQLSLVIAAIGQPPLPTLSPEGERAIQDSELISLFPLGERGGEKGARL